MADFRAIYNNLILIYPAVAKVPAKPAIVFARILEYSTIHGDDGIHEWYIDRNPREVEVARVIILSAYQRVCRLICVEPDLWAVQLAMVMHALARLHDITREKGNLCLIPHVGNLEQYVEALCLMHSAIGPDLASIVCTYAWHNNLIAPRGRTLAFDHVPKHILFGASYPSDHFKYADDYIDALRTAHPDIDLSAESVNDFIIKCTKIDGTFICYNNRMAAMGIPKKQIGNINRMQALLNIAGI